MRKNLFRKRKISLKIKALSIFLLVLLILIVLIIIDLNSPALNQSGINPPERDITHNENLGQITEFNLSIEKLSINVPIIPNVDGKDKKTYSDALNGGVAHYKNTGLPDSGSNIVIFGHSSTILGIGKYSDIFADLNNLELSDTIRINFNQNEYKYSVSEKKVIAADDFSVILPTKREELTLLTCWPVGTADKRLAITAKPIQ